MCVAHGKPLACHVSSCMALLEPLYRGVPIQLMAAQRECMRGAARRRKRKGGEEKRNGGKERRKGGK